MRKLHLEPQYQQALAQMRAQGLPIWQCADLLGVSYKVAKRWATEMGLTARLHRGPISGQRLAQEARRA